jgi:basic amino acid/polyamine antiporter, APA family
VVEHEAEYDSVLVPRADGEYDGSVVATAAKLAARKRRGIHVLVLITVPASLPIREAMPDAEAAA